jgi:hypothetical protein
MWSESYFISIDLFSMFFCAFYSCSGTILVRK